MSNHTPGLKPKNLICVYTLAANHREFRQELEERLHTLGVQGTYSDGRYLAGNLCFHFVGGNTAHSRSAWLLAFTSRRVASLQLLGASKVGG